MPKIKIHIINHINQLKESVQMMNTTEEIKRRIPAKRIEILSLKEVRSLEVTREGSIDYLPRKVSSPTDAIGLCREFLDDLPIEHMIAISLNTKNEFNNISTISMGTLNSSLAHPREIFKMAIKTNANSIILAHNHPSGDPEPSREDTDLTSRIRKAGELLGITLLDHIIIGDKNGNRYFSFKENKLL